MNDTLTELPPPSPLVKLNPRATLSPSDIQQMIADMQQAIRDALRMGYFARMEINHDARWNWWEGQTPDGLRWGMDEVRGSSVNRLRPNELPDVFPWPGASDVRVGLIDLVIRERVAMLKLALQRRQERIGPRDFSSGNDPQAKAALWGQVSDYYEDVAKLEFRTAMAQWSDVAEEYGWALLYVGWREDEQVVEKTIQPQDLMRMVAFAAHDVAHHAAAAQWEAGGNDPEQFPGLNKLQSHQVITGAAFRLKEMMTDPTQKSALVAALMTYDPAMPRSEATRVAASLKLGQPVSYYATSPFSASPEFKVFTPFIDCIVPATTERVKTSPWVATTEYVSEAELRARIETHGYDEAWVAQVLTKPGRTFILTDITGMDKFNWVLSHGGVRTGLRSTATDDPTQNKVYQLLHAHYRPVALGNVRAVMHTVLHGQVADSYGLHECCEYAHGQFPLMELLSEIEAPFLLAARGAGEKTFTDQNEVKTQRDMRTDAASFMIKPPVQVPWMDGKKTIDALRPGRVIPLRTSMGMGSSIIPVDLKIDTRGSLEVEMTTMDAFNEKWYRGTKMDPVMKQTRQQVMVSDFLLQVREAKLMVFRLVQEFAPDDLKATFVNGLPVNLAVTREEIQGMPSLEIDFDVGGLDSDQVKDKLASLGELLGADNQNVINRTPILSAAAAWLFPAQWATMIKQPDQTAQDEVADEQSINSQILNGTQFDQEGSYVIGTDHKLRLQTMQGIYGVQTDDKGTVIQMIPNGPPGKGDGGAPIRQPSRAQNIYQADPDVQTRVNNRLQFHARQIIQQQVNPQTGRNLVESTPAPTAPAAQGQDGAQQPKS